MPKTVVIVEDEQFVLLGLRSHLSEHAEDFAVAGSFRNGSEALSFCLARPPDIILTDIRMPVMDGIEFIQRLRSAGVKSSVVVLTCHDDFQLVRAAFQAGANTYVLKHEVESDELIVTLRALDADSSPDGPAGHTQPAHERPLHFTDIASVYTADRSPGSGAEAFHRLPFDRTSSVILGVIGFKTAYDEACKPVPWLHDERVLYELVEERARRIPSAVAVVGPHADVLVLHSANTGSSYRGVADAYQALLVKLDALFNRTSFIGFSHPFPVSEMGPEHYEEAKASLSRMFFSEDKRVLFAVDDPTGTTSMSQLPDLRLFDDIEHWLSEVSRYCADRAAERDQSPSEIRNEFRRCLVQLDLRLRSTFGRSISETLSIVDRELLTAIDEFDDLSVLFRWTARLLRQLWSTMSSGQLGDPVIARIVDYIQANYADDISLRQVAETFHFNANYLSSYFHREVGKTFGQYLQEIRIEAAKELLKNPELSVKEVSAAAGFDSVSYFSRVFKRAVGHTASDYRTG